MSSSSDSTSEVLVTTSRDEHGHRTVRIHRADSRIFITQEFLDDADPASVEQGEGLVRLCRSVAYRLDTYYGPGEIVPGIYCSGPGWMATLIRATAS